MGHKLSPVLKSHQYDYHCKHGLECTAISNGAKHNFTCMQKSASEISKFTMKKSSLMVKTHCENVLFKATFTIIILLTRLLKTDEPFCELSGNASNTIISCWITDGLFNIVDILMLLKTVNVYSVSLIYKYPQSTTNTPEKTLYRAYFTPKHAPKY